MAKIDRVQEVSTELLVPYANNAKKHSKEQVDKIAESIKSFGFLSPCLIDNDYNIIAGHGRVMAALQIGLPTVPCVFIDGLSEAERRAYILADNRLTELGDWDIDIVQEELEALQDMDFDVDLTGFEVETENINEPKIIEDDYDEENVETRVKLGDLWQLGKHRLICGDSTDPNIIEKLMGGKKADMVFTDPPYGINVVGKNGHIGGSTKGVEVTDYKPVVGDDKEFDPRFIFLLFNDCDVFLWGANYYANKLDNSGRWIVWDKNRGEGTTFSDCELCWTNLAGVLVKKYKCTWDGMRREGESGKRYHPTQKPIKLFADIIRDYSNNNELIVDLFGGSGSTLIACEQLNRACFMAEIDPHYCDVIINRWEQLTGEKAVLLNGSN